MANILVSIEKGIEVAAEDVLHFLSNANNQLKATPKVIAALGTMIGAVTKATGDFSTAAQSGGLNIALDELTFNEIKAVWPDVKAFLATLGIKL